MRQCTEFLEISTWLSPTVKISRLKSVFCAISIHLVAFREANKKIYSESLCLHCNNNGQIIELSQTLQSYKMEQKFRIFGIKYQIDPIGPIRGLQL